MFLFQYSSGASEPGPYGNFNSTGWADSLLNTLSLDEKIGQLFMVAAFSNRNSQYENNLIATLRKFHIGGVCFFQGDPEGQAELTNKIQKNSRLPLFIAMDVEQGITRYYDSTYIFPSALTMGAVQDDRVLYNLSARVAEELKLLGVNVAFGPVVNVDNTGQHQLSDYHLFGDDRDLVAAKAGAFMEGLQDKGILTVSKYFPAQEEKIMPGMHFPVVTHTAQYLDSIDLFPFRKLIENKIMGIMTPNTNILSLDKNPVPASISANVNDLLRTKMGFNGLLFTDALNSSSVSGLFPPGEIEVRAFMAGADIIFLPDNLAAAIVEIKKAIQTRKIKKSDLNEHVKKILLAKQRLNLISYKAIDIHKASIFEHEELTRSVNEMVYEKAVTELQDKDNFLPVTILDTLKFASLSIGNPVNDGFQTMLDNYAPFDHFVLDGKEHEAEDYTRLSDKLSAYNVIIVGIHPANPSHPKNPAISKNDILFLRSLTSHAKVILVLFGNPADASAFSSFSHIICAYEDNAYTERIVPQAIFGAISFEGKLPVSISGDWKTGSGIMTEAIGRLGYSYPENVGFNIHYLNYIDTIVTDAIRSKAMPGCRVLVAREGKVVFDRSYGYFTYDSLLPVRENSIYDLASLTKVMGTLQAVKILAERKIIDLDKKASVYLPELRNTNKEDLIIRDLLTHQSGLRRYIPFYKKTIDSPADKRYYYSSTLSDDYPYPIAPGMNAARYLSDSVWSWIIQCPLREKISPKPYNYRYSDIGFYILYKMVERIINQPLNEFLQQNIYDPLGLYTITYLPAGKFPTDSIVPSTVDNDFRNSRLQGYVQDEQAALFDGVCGHAGLFSDAHDLAVIMQMELQKGYYGGFQYFKPETIEEFTQQQYRMNRRGLGWDRPNSSDKNRSPASGYASSASFGHTGFTGTMVWADPDKELVYVFLSNRTYPDMDNEKLNELDVRKRIQTVIYSALLKH